MDRAERDAAQRERATKAWELVVEVRPDTAGLERLRRILRAKRFERAELAAALPGVVRRGARIDLEPVRAALAEAGIACALRRRSDAGGEATTKGKKDEGEEEEGER